MSATATRLVDEPETGPTAPICLTWELTYATWPACIAYRARAGAIPASGPLIISRAYGCLRYSVFDL
jgi:hypothetical protein